MSLCRILLQDWERGFASFTAERSCDFSCAYSEFEISAPAETNARLTDVDQVLCQTVAEKKLNIQVTFKNPALQVNQRTKVHLVVYTAAEIIPVMPLCATDNNQ